MQIKATSRIAFGTAAAIAVVLVVVLFSVGRHTGAPSVGAASQNQNYVTPVDVVPFASRLLCTMLGGDQPGMKILGWDGWDNVQWSSADPTPTKITYWQFGDTMVDRAPFNGIFDNGFELNFNGAAYTSSTPPPFDPNVNPWTRQCFPDLKTKNDAPAGTPTPQPLLPNASFESKRGFPTGWVQPNAGDEWIYFFYDSDIPGGTGVGLARMCAKTSGCSTPTPSGPSPAYLSSERIPATPGAPCTTTACLFWRQSDCPSNAVVSSVQSLVEGGYMYAFIDIYDSPPPANFGTGLARVPTSQIGTLSAYEYYTGTPANPWVAWGPNGEGRCQMKQLWSQLPWKTNSILVRKNAFLNSFIGDKYLAIYTGGIAGIGAARTASSLTGPWSAETTLFDCATFMKQEDVTFPDPDATPGATYLCYTHRPHPQFETNGGQNIFVTYSNPKSYRVYLQEVALAKPVYEWSNGTASAYRLAGDSLPSPWQQNGVAFYALQYPVDTSFDAIKEWTKDGEYRYGKSAPAGTGWTTDDHVWFYAIDANSFPEIRTQHGFASSGNYAPVYLWTKAGSPARYAALDLSGQGYTRAAAPLAFIATCPGTQCAKGGQYDSDGDGAPDVVEVNVSANPLRSDTDGDGLSDGAEINGIVTTWGTFKTDPIAKDTDRDGCTDGQEVGQDPTKGGVRNPLNFWDFTDMPAPQTRDRQITIADVSAVVNHYRVDDSATRVPRLPNLNSNPLATPAPHVVPPTPTPSPTFIYHPAFDRSFFTATPGPSATPGGPTPVPWGRLGPPNGQILIDDITAVINQYRHDCRDATPTPTP